MAILQFGKYNKTGKPATPFNSTIIPNSRNHHVCSTIVLPLLQSASTVLLCARIDLPKAPPQRYIVPIPSISGILDVYYCPFAQRPQRHGERSRHGLHSKVESRQGSRRRANATPAFDPQETPRVHRFNCTVIASSSNPSYRLTLQTMQNTLRFLYDLLYDSPKFGSTATGVSNAGVRQDMDQLGVVSIASCGEQWSEIAGFSIAIGGNDDESIRRFSKYSYTEYSNIYCSEIPSSELLNSRPGAFTNVAD